MIQIITTENDFKALINEALNEALDRLPTQSSKVIEIIDGKTLAKRLGISAPTLIRWREKGRIPYLSIGGGIRYNFPEVVEALEAKGA